MIDLGKETIDISCPGCDFNNTVYLKQVRLRNVIICRGCKANIRLNDYLCETKKAIHGLNKVLRNLLKPQKEFRINI